MRIVEAKWTPRVNVLTIECECGKLFDHRTDRWRAKCPKCGTVQDLGDIRERYRAKSTCQFCDGTGRLYGGDICDACEPWVRRGP